MEPNLFFRYVGANKDNTSEIPLDDLGVSLIGFDKVIHEFADVCHLNAEINVMVNSKHEGSLILEAIVKVNILPDALPFESINHLLDFLKIWSEESFQIAQSYFNNLKDLHTSLNDYFQKYPFDSAAFCFIIPYFFNKLKDKKIDNELPKNIAVKLFTLIKKNIFYKILSPIINETVTSIEISHDKEFKKCPQIDNRNFENFLGEENEILPNLKHNETYDFIGEITSLKSTRGDMLTFHYKDEKKDYNLDLFPPEGKNTKNFTEFYKENVFLKAQVERSSVYKKPKLYLVDIQISQAELPLKL